MRYLVELSKVTVEKQSVFLNCSDPREALKAAEGTFPGFSARHAVEAEDEDNLGECFEKEGTCEGCDKILLTGVDYYLSTDDGDFCVACVKQMQEAFCKARKEKKQKPQSQPNASS